MNLSRYLVHRIRQGKHSYTHFIRTLSIVSLLLGVAMSVVSIVVMRGFQTAIQNKIFEFQPPITLSAYRTQESLERKPFVLSDSMRTVLQRNTYIKSITPTGNKAGLLRLREDVWGIVFKGVSPSSNLHPFLKEGKSLSFSDSTYSSDIWISAVQAAQWNKHVGDSLVIHFLQNPPRARKLYIAGIYETHLSEFFDNRMVLGDFRLIQHLNDWAANEAGEYDIQLDLAKISVTTLPDSSDTFFSWLQAEWLRDTNLDRVKIEAVQQQLHQQLDYNVAVESVIEKFSVVFDWMNLINRQVSILVAIILIVISVNLISIAIILILERMQWVGMMKAMGAPDSLIRSVFFNLIFTLILRGIAWGNAVGITICALQYYFKIIPLDPKNYYVDYVPIEWNWSGILFLNVLVLAVLALVWLLPAQIIKRISPISHLRFS